MLSRGETDIEREKHKNVKSSEQKVKICPLRSLPTKLHTYEQPQAVQTKNQVALNVLNFLSYSLLSNTVVQHAKYGSIKV